ncbi:hypothetical protein Acr_23g0004310 [Actinidia rufa]|uniref:Reverse transcriptase domain-containing protein n=1 Tax=Actinidia rufa TaxID=165716 RepID=A0A7J0GMK1_9ERIC|nr:hypothetical protein Acr_23g0004310 [Actinidia rufa]
MHLHNCLLPRLSASSLLDNRAHPKANTSQAPDLEGLHLKGRRSEEEEDLLVVMTKYQDTEIDPPLRRSGILTPVLTPSTQLKEQITDLIKKGYLRKYIADRPPSNSLERRYGDNRPTAGDIQVIHGGFGFDGCSSSSRKRHAKSTNGRAEEEVYNLSYATIDTHPPITFNNDDLRGLLLPHDDALIVSAVITNSNIQKILVDNGSSADILFISDFIVMDCPSPYNAILGRPMLEGVKAITSTDHLKMKFPTSIGIEEEVTKLIKAGVIREVQYPEWLVNVVVALKKWGKWRLCVDFTDLNKACPKDNFLLPKIDLIVDATSKHKPLSFMDAFFGYHQTKMHPPNVEKTFFITKRGLYCYKVMPFGLKNAGATYQRLVNKMFKDLIGRTMEVYIDDKLIKSIKTADHIATWKKRLAFYEAPNDVESFQMHLWDIDVTLPKEAPTEQNPNEDLARWTLFVDGSSNQHDCGAGLVFQTPFGEQMDYAIWTGFRAINNEAEYESLLARLRVATEFGVDSLEAFSEVKTISRKIKDFRIRQIPREENRNADALVNLTLAFDFISDRSIPLEFLANPSIEFAKSICQVNASPTRMNDIMAYLQTSALPSDKFLDHQI